MSCVLANLLSTRSFNLGKPVNTCNEWFINYFTMMQQDCKKRLLYDSNELLKDVEHYVNTNIYTF